MLKQDINMNIIVTIEINHDAIRQFKSNLLITEFFVNLLKRNRIPEQALNDRIRVNMILSEMLCENIKSKR